jgi:hypothetical protein
VLVALYVERGLWDRFLARQALALSVPARRDAALPTSQDCGRTLAVTLWPVAATLR